MGGMGENSAIALGIVSPDAADRKSINNKQKTETKSRGTSTLPDVQATLSAYFLRLSK